jgi:hypothetical protein
MIKKDDMFQPMLDANPALILAWGEFVEKWKDEKDGLPFYLALGDLARHLVDQLKLGRTEEFAPVFAVVERWHCEGDHYVREAATVGLLESIQNIAGHEGLDPAHFEQWFGPETKRWWDKLNLFWSEGKLLTDE